MLNAAQGQVYSAEGKISAAQGAINSARVSVRSFWKLFTISGSLFKVKYWSLSHVFQATSANKELTDANEIRASDAAQFKEEEKLLLQSLSELEGASRVIRAAHNKNSLLSTSAKKSMMQVVSSLDAVTESIGIEFEDHAKLQALVQADEEDDDLSPVRGTASYFSTNWISIVVNFWFLRKQNRYIVCVRIPFRWFDHFA